jgi:hypothetical protein
MRGVLLKQLGLILAFMLILMPMMALASDLISENLNIQKELYLKSFDFEPKHVKMDGSVRTVNFLATIYAKNGILNNVSTGFATRATFLGPYSFPYLYKDEMNVTFLPPPILGDVANGSYTYEGTVDLPRGTKEGVWQLESIKLVDGHGAIRELKGDDLGPLPKELYVEVGFSRWVLVLVCIQFVFFGILYVIYTLTSKKKSISMIWKGYDGATSSSKFQFFLWTFVAMYAYIIIIADAYFNHGIVLLSLSVPQNLMLTMGLSATTMLAAKGITTKYVTDGTVVKSDTSKGGLFFDDDGYPDLSQIQLISWTFIGAGIFLLKTLNDSIGSPGATTGLPDIDQTLLILMGIGEGAYIGKKIATKDDPEAPTLSKITPDKGKKTEQITLTGTNFGDKLDESFITIGDKRVQSKKDTMGAYLVKWEKGKVTFKLDDIEFASDKERDNTFKKGSIVEIGVIAGKKSSVKNLPFQIEE